MGDPGRRKKEKKMKIKTFAVRRFTSASTEMIKVFIDINLPNYSFEEAIARVV